MTTKSMPARDLAFLMTESNGNLSRNSITIPSGTGEVVAGTVLGELTTTAGHYVPSPDVETVGIEGAETATAILGYYIDATDQDVEVAVVDKDAEVKLGSLLFDASVDDEPKTAAKIAQLNAVGIRAR